MRRIPELDAVRGLAAVAIVLFHWRFHWPFQIQTRSPMRARSTPSPTASTTPAPSLCGMTRGNTLGRLRPSLVFQSEGFTPEVARRTSTSVDLPDGSWMTSPSRRTSTGPSTATVSIARA